MTKCFVKEAPIPGRDDHSGCCHTDARGEVNSISPLSVSESMQIHGTKTFVLGTWTCANAGKVVPLESEVFNSKNDSALRAMWVTSQVPWVDESG